MQKQKLKLMYIITIVVLCSTIALSAILDYMLYKTHLTEIYANMYNVSISSLTNKVEQSINFGKPLNNFYGMEELLQEQCETIDELENISVYNNELELLYTGYLNNLDDGTNSKKIPKANEYMIDDDRFYYSIPINSTHNETGKSEIVGMFFLEVDSTSLNQSISLYTKQLLTFAGIEVLIFGILLLVVYLYIYFKNNNANMLRSFSVIILVSTQIIFGLFAYFHYFDSYTNSFKQLSDTVSILVEKDIDKLGQNEIHFDELYGVDEYLETYNEKLHVFEEIKLVNNVKVFNSSNSTQISSPMSLDGKVYMLECTVDQEQINYQTFEFILNILLLLTISFLLIIETQFLILSGFSNKESKTSNKRTDSTAILRILIFVLYSAVSMGLALSPIVADKLYTADLGVDKSFAVGLPITAEMLSGLVAILFSGYLLKKLNFKKSFYIAIIITALGLLASAFSTTIYIYTFSRAIVGFGFALIMILGRNYSSSQTNPEVRTKILSNLSGGSIAGICFGSTLGGILAKYISFSQVFILSAIMIVLALIIVPMIEYPKQVVAKNDNLIKNLLVLFKEKSSLIYLLFIVIPIYSSTIFISYAVPIVGIKYDMSTTSISALIMVNSLIAGYLSPYLTKITLNKWGMAKTVFAYIAITALSIFIFAVFESPLILLFVVITLGIADSFGLVGLIEGFQQTKGAVLGDSSVNMIALTMSGKAGQSVAPSIMSIFGGSSIGLSIFVILGAVFYVVISKVSVKSSTSIKRGKGMGD